MSRHFAARIAAVLIAGFTFTSVLSGCGQKTLGQNETTGQEQTTSQQEQTTQAQTSGQETTAAPAETSKPEETSAPAGSNMPGKRAPVKVKALYLTGWTVGSDEKVQKYIDIAKTTEINSYVVDIKDDDGLVGYESQIPAVREIGAWTRKYDADKVLKAFHDNGIHVIGRLVVFKDPILSSKKPELAIKHANGGLWKDNHKLTWLSPYNRDSWPYIIEIAKEAVKKGFDEIQFDYIRFANDGDKKAMNFGTQDKKKDEIICEFISYARKELPDVILSADVFGIICESPGDTEGIGQNLEKVGMELDYISPMVYPSHYAVGQKVNGVQFMKPDMDPYGVVYQTLLKANKRISQVEGYRAGVRPYLQDFTASWLGKGYYQTYGVEQVKQQIKATYDAGYDEWILWDANNKYEIGALEKE